MSELDNLRNRASELALHGLVLHFDDVDGADWVPWLIGVEEVERNRRSLARRLKLAKLAKYKPITDFDWRWPEAIDRTQIDRLFTLQFADEGANIILVGPNGVGKTMLMKNLAYACLIHGHTAQFITASAMLNALAAEDSATALERRFRRLCRPAVLCLDEVGYLSYGNRHADLLFEVVTRRYEMSKSIIVTTNKAFRDWNQVFPNATSVVTLVDRLIHRSEVVQITGSSYRLKEAQEQAAARKKATPKRAVT